MPRFTAARAEATFVDDEGVTIHYYSWRSPKPVGVVQLVHGVGEYATRYEPLAQALVASGFHVYAGDLRGHGQTGLEQWGGDRAKLGRLGPGGVRATIAGIRLLSAIARGEHPHLPLTLLGHSLGSLFAQKIANVAAGEYDGLVLSGTAYRTPVHMNGGDLAAKHRGPTGAEWLSRDPAVAEAFAADPLTVDAKVLQLFGLADTLRLLGRPRRLAKDLPLLIQIGSEDPLGGPRSVQLLARAYERRGRLTDVTVEIYEGARHEVYNETNREEVVADLLEWLHHHVVARADAARDG